MKELAFQVLSLVSVVFIPFIPSSSLRYISVVFAALFLVAYLVYNNTPNRQGSRLNASMEDINTLFDTATSECTTWDPRFIYEAGLKLTKLNYAVSTLRSRTISMKSMRWKVYANHFWAMASSIKECRREIEDFRSSIQLALECARRQRYSEGIDRQMATLANAFTNGIQQSSVTWGLLFLTEKTGSNRYSFAQNVNAGRRQIRPHANSE
ncbi:hypothetical protein B0H12DRAFT_1123942 [Mycena haematopus]|nr:hypothetical protein B0H12DRAFT_1123942 [Mycena haematopus]